MESMSTHGASSSCSERERKRKRTSSSSSASTSGWKYEVFLSFYGKDTRKSFTDHLYAALKRKSILTFRDDEKLQRGKCIAPELLKAIQESIYGIIVISPNYVSSKWCLMELVEIFKCMGEKDTILPVFYHVLPSTVREQRNTFAKAFDKHEKDPEVDMEQIQTWKDALTKVANTSGWDLQDG
ncbi:TMV resistance protein N [Morella rubra]|uniref:TMV resistance protein N n=1 Tax=Morella rubra TaxID=262757 RepID=A0A6A1WBK2_9ROSI|nr:TMV resistance protein N [Morella rubra]